MEGIAVGQRGRAEVVVDESNVAHGPRKVLSTPELVRLLERAAAEATDPRLPSGWGTVGYSVNIRHLASAPLGATVVATALITDVDRRRIEYRVEARDGDTIVGEGTHERFAVDLDRFMAARPARTGPAGGA